MKKQLLPILAIVFTFLLSACHADPVTAPSEGITQPTETAVQDSMETVAATLPPETMPETVPTETVMVSEHSPLYIPGISVEEVILYFNEVCLDAEFVNSGNPNLLQKWVIPIRYWLHGNYTQEDLEFLTSFTQWLNTLEGFPGIQMAGEEEIPNLQIHFCDQGEMISYMGENFYGLDGGVTFWYDYNEIYDGIICYRTDISQHTRNSVILEELYNGLGPIQDTDLREDSILYSGFSEPQNLTEIDELILKLLYHPRMICGMDAAECEAAIRQLYY